MLEILGIVSAICMSISCLPQAWAVYKKGSADELSLASLVLWFVGELCYIAYILPLLHIPLLLNCIPAIVCSLTMLYYKLFPRGDTKCDIPD